jgi:hypothetical protein
MEREYIPFSITARSRASALYRARRLAQALVALAAVAGVAREAQAIPAFARKYGLRCTACHEAWPALNDFGRAFRDNGYQLMLGHDAPTWFPPEYWPLSIRATPRYEFTSVSHQPTDQGTKTIKTGSVTDIGIDLLIGGTLLNNISFLVVPTGFASDGSVTLESAWVRFDNLLDSPYLNLKIGKHEVDLPRSAHRPWNLSDTGYLIYSYHPKGSISQFDLGENQRGAEWVAHDRGSFNRVAVSVFSVEGSPGSSTAFDTPGAYAHASHQTLFDNPWVSAARVGAFGAYTTWPTATLTSMGTPIGGTGSRLRSSSRYGIEGHLWFGPPATPLHMILVGAAGSDSRSLIQNANRTGTWAGGFLEIGYTPLLRTTLFFRWDLIRNQQQPIAGTPRDVNDEDAYTGGIRYTLGFTSRAEVALHLEYSTVQTKKLAADGHDVTSDTVFVGADFAL